MAAPVSEHTGQKTHDRLGYHEDGGLSPDEHIIADADLFDVHRPCGLIDHALVDALVATAREQQVPATGVAMGVGLGERAPGWRGDDQQWAIDIVGPGLICAGIGYGPNRSGVVGIRAGRGLGSSRGYEIVQRVTPDRGAHDHARAPAERGVVNGAVDVMRPVPQIVYPELDDAAVDGAPEERDPERGQVLGKDGDDVKAQGRSRPD